MRYRPASVVPATKLPSPRELGETDGVLFGECLFSLVVGSRRVEGKIVEAAPQEGQLIAFSVIAEEQTGHLFIKLVFYG